MTSSLANKPHFSLFCNMATPFSDHTVCHASPNLLNISLKIRDYQTGEYISTGGQYLGVLPETLYLTTPTAEPVLQKPSHLLLSFSVDQQSIPSTHARKQRCENKEAYIQHIKFMLSQNSLEFDTDHVDFLMRIDTQGILQQSDRFSVEQMQAVITHYETTTLATLKATAEADIASSMAADTKKPLPTATTATKEPLQNVATSEHGASLYDFYKAERNDLTFQRYPIPPFDEMREETQRKWTAACAPLLNLGELVYNRYRNASDSLHNYTSTGNIPTWEALSEEFQEAFNKTAINFIINNDTPSPR